MSRFTVLRAIVVVWWLLMAAIGHAAETASALEARSRALERASASVVGLQALAVSGARSAATLGRARQGSGVVIDAEGLVLTIGYLILEADQVLILTDDGKRVPARVVAYDLATGFGLVKALTPLGIVPAPLGRGGGLTRDDELMIASGGDAGALSMARMVSRRGFSGYWEYHIEGALFTSPPRPDHSGAGLFNGRGELVGIGSLIVNDAAGGGSRLPGNMFVPTDLLLPILSELIADGRSRQSVRPWIGINCIESGSQVRVVRVNEDSPADVAGIEVGDRITGIDGHKVEGLEQLWKALWAGKVPGRAVDVDIERDGKAQRITVHTVDRAMTLKRPAGV